MYWLSLHASFYRFPVILRRLEVRVFHNNTSKNLIGVSESLERMEQSQELETMVPHYLVHFLQTISFSRNARTITCFYAQYRMLIAKLRNHL